jgi:hypothetical protein
VVCYLFKRISIPVFAGTEEERIASEDARCNAHVERSLGREAKVVSSTIKSLDWEIDLINLPQDRGCPVSLTIREQEIFKSDGASDRDVTAHVSFPITENYGLFTKRHPTDRVRRRLRVQLENTHHGGRYQQDFQLERRQLRQNGVSTSRVVNCTSDRAQCFLINCTEARNSLPMLPPPPPQQQIKSPGGGARKWKVELPVSKAVWKRTSETTTMGLEECPWDEAIDYEKSEAGAGGSLE